MFNNSKSNSDLWQTGTQDELEFWESWLRTEGREWPEDYKARLNPETQLYLPLIRFVPPWATQVQVLDVGAGPITTLGYVYPGLEVRLTATDALAREYSQLLGKYGVTPPVQTHYAPAEELSKYLKPNTYDVVHCANALDHCRSPLDALREMLKVCKPCGYIYLMHSENEGKRENYIGLHQWDFSIDSAGDFTIQHRSGNVVNVRRALGRKLMAIHSRLVDERVEVILQKSLN